MRAMLLAICLTACAAVPGEAGRSAPFATAAAAPAAADFPIAVDLPAGAYRLDRRHASVHFRIRHMGLSWFTARFDGIEATLELDPADPSRSRLNASVAAASVNTGVLDGDGERSFDRAIARALGAETAPEMVFVSTAIERTGPHSARAVGDLSMNGQTHPATFDISFAGNEVQIVVEAEFVKQ